MKFFFFVILSTFIYLSNAICGTQCNRDYVPDGVITGNINVINTEYDVGGTIVIKNDCEFEIQNFYATPQMNAQWYCARSHDSFEGILVSRNIVSLFNKNAPTTLSYDIYDTDPFCHASIFYDCKEFRLMDGDQLIASAILEENLNETEQEEELEPELEPEPKKSLTWLYALLGVLSGFALASLLAFGYIQKNKKTKIDNNNNSINNNNNNNNSNDDSNNNNNEDNEEPPPYCEIIRQYPTDEDITIIHTNTTLTHNDISVIRNNPSINRNYNSLSRINNSLSFNDNSLCRNFNSLSRIDHSLSRNDNSLNRNDNSLHNSISLVNKEKSYKIIY